MSISGLLSATFHEPGYCHLVEMVHQRDLDARRHLASLRVAAHNPSGFLHRSVAVDPNLGVVDLAILLGPLTPEAVRLFVLFDARSDPDLFPYRVPVPAASLRISPR